MGKGNFILGTGSSSIGDVTFARRNGQQIARVRVRKIKNPKSQGQAEQRMIAAEVVKFYSPLSHVLETSFEGLSKADSYAKFLSINMNLAKQNGYGVPKGTGFVALPFQISGGTLPTPIVAFQDGEEALELVTGTLTRPGGAEVWTWGDVSSAIIAKYGLQNGDQITFIALTSNGTLNYKRYFLDTTSSVDIDTMDLGTDLKSDENGIIFYGNGGESALSLGVIFSRWENDAWRRSTSSMVCTAGYLANYTGSENLAAAIASYMKGAGQVPVSDIYLNGSDD